MSAVRSGGSAHDAEMCSITERRSQVTVCRLNIWARRSPYGGDVRLATNGTRHPSIKSGNWCPFCARNRELEFEQMRQIARERGGRCLSTAYRNGRTPLLWECSQRHRWRARPANIKGGTRKKGSWCLECYNTRRIFLVRSKTFKQCEIGSLVEDGNACPRNTSAARPS